MPAGDRTRVIFSALDPAASTVLRVARIPMVLGWWNTISASKYRRQPGSFYGCHLGNRWVGWQP
jgi:hypothetical protein